MKHKAPTKGPAKLIQRMGLSLRGLAKVSGVSADTLARSVRSNTWPKQVRVNALLRKALGVEA